MQKIYVFFLMIFCVDAKGSILPRFEKAANFDRENVDINIINKSCVLFPL